MWNLQSHILKPSKVLSFIRPQKPGRDLVFGGCLFVEGCRLEGQTRAVDAFEAASDYVSRNSPNYP